MMSICMSRSLTIPMAFVYCRSAAHACLIEPALSNLSGQLLEAPLAELRLSKAVTC
jgi:hypothetical protein